MAPSTSSSARGRWSTGSRARSASTRRTPRRSSRLAPAEFTLHARNPDRDVVFGGRHLVFGSVGGPAFANDLDRGRRAGTFADFQEYVRLVGALDVIHQEGGGPIEPNDLPVETRHLDMYRTFATELDKTWQGLGFGATVVEDALDVLGIVRGVDRETLVREPSAMTVINTNSPLRLDGPMGDGLIHMARFGQPVVATPFTLAGAMSVVSLAGAIAQQNAEALFLVALAQIVRPGTPMIYGAFTSNVDMRTGAPAFGTPEYVKGALASGQMARRYGLPWRSSNATASNVVDAQAAYESEMAVWGSIMGGVNLLYQGAGWLEGGLTASYEKLIIDAEILQMMSEVLQPLEVSEATLGFDALADVGPGRSLLRERAYARTLRDGLLPPARVRLAQLRDVGGRRRPDRHGTGEHHLEAAARRGGAACARSRPGRGARRVRGASEAGDPRRGLSGGAAPDRNTRGPFIDAIGESRGLGVDRIRIPPIDAGRPAPSPNGPRRFLRVDGVVATATVDNATTVVSLSGQRTKRPRRPPIMAIATPILERPQLDVDFAAPAGREALERAATSLSSHGFETVIVSDGATARDFVLAQIPRGSTVHWGAGVTVDQIGLADALSVSGDVEALRPRLSAMDRATQGDEMRRIGTVPDVFVNSANAVTEDGSIVSGSASGSQLGPIVFGAGRVFFVIGAQKVVPDLEIRPPAHRDPRRPARGRPSPRGVRLPHGPQQGPDPQRRASRPHHRGPRRGGHRLLKRLTA